MNKRAFSLIELSIVMGVMAVLASSIIPVAIRSVQIRAGEKTALEMAMLQEAGRNYYVDHHVWPVDIPTMQSQGYLNSQWNALNPWHNAYLISSSSLQMTVSSDVPSQWANLVASHLPAAVVNGSNVSSTISSLGSASLASGVIVAWSGAIANIPTGWALCDGSNGTPDLRDKFIVGARQDIAGIAQSNIMGNPLSVGGSVTHHHGGQTGPHILTIAEMPSHHFTVNTNDSTFQPGGPTYIKIDPQAALTGTMNTNTLGNDQPHSHPISNDFHVPPFYALAFIIKL